MTDQSMRVVLVRGGKGGADALYLGRSAKPEPAPGQILIKVHAAGVNRPDISQREGNYPPPPGAPDIMGLEVAGVIEALGAGTTRWQCGDRVAALLPSGGYADYAVVDGRHALPVPERLSMNEAAALPETVFTVWSNLFERARLTAVETVLIHGANSGIGTTAIQMAKAAGARVVATARGAAKAAKALEAGADISVDTTHQDFVAIVQEQGGADVILDIVGGSYFARNIEALKVEGRIAQIAFLDSRMVELDLKTLLFKRIAIIGSTLRARDADEKARLTQAIEQRVWPWLVEGEVRPIVERTFPISAVADAHRHLERGEQFGKVTLYFD